MRVQNKVVLFLCLLAVSINSEDSENDFGTVEKNGLSYRTFIRTTFIIDYELLVIKKRAIANIEEMEQLSIHGSSTHTIEPGAFENLPRLRTLTMKNCRLEEIKAGVFNVLNVTELEITQSGVSRIDPEAFDGMTKLFSIRLDGNQLSRWNSRWFEQTPNLKAIFVNNNLLEEIPAKAFTNLKSLRDLCFNGNRIKKIHDEAFTGLEEISILTFMDNQMESFSGNFLSSGVAIDELFLNNNNITCIAEEDFANTFTAGYTELDGNPLEEECWKKIQIWAKKNKKMVLYY